MTISPPRTAPVVAPAVPEKKARPPLHRRIWRDRVMLMLALPGLLYFLVFHYAPLFGYVVAFQDYQPYLGYLNSPWVGLQNFATVFSDSRFWDSIVNTLQITVTQLVLFFPAPIALALLLHSVMSEKIRRFVQSVVYLPHFIGWVIIVSIFQQILGGAGVLPDLLAGVGLPRWDMMTDPDTFPLLVTLQLLWKDAGWGTIIFLAALLSINQELYEAAAMDGAGRWRRLWHVTLPGITPIVILLLILNLGSILSVGFEQILLQRDAVGAEAGEVLDTFIYHYGVRDGQWGAAAAVGLFKAVVGAALVLGANKVAHLLGHEGVYRGAAK
ncbi:ABC transporter permease [Nonomuraea soli]|uniref:Putative aldouronate transport system permease protein n=1 Tax=Nonomuraea soli TaxID=1032476 RepID=A0A7W0CR50_9ACTN|nr:ABC transporter permease subunit [Nonomuraea soli]MBA2895806.1 putative aldouronate transport system permease protein [Nonomuraea soli]